MSQRTSRIAVYTVAALSAALMLAGCAPTPTPTTTPSVASSAPTSSSTPSSTPSAAPSVAPTSTAAPGAQGCAPTTAAMPAGAVTKKVLDVDGDGLADTEWISDSPTLEFGVTTASGATFAYSLNSASPASRVGFIARLNDHRIVSIVDDNRNAYVHFIVNCAWVTPKNSHGKQYTFDMNDFAGTGTGVGCSLGYVVGYQTVPAGSNFTVTESKMQLNTTGSYASPGPWTAVVTNVPGSNPHVKAASTISCGTATIANSGVSVG